MSRLSPLTLPFYLVIYILSVKWSQTTWPNNSFSPFSEMGFHVIQGSLELTMYLKVTLDLIFLPVYPKCWDNTRVPPGCAHAVLGIKVRTSCVLGKLAANWATSPAPKHRLL